MLTAPRCPIAGLRTTTLPSTSSNYPRRHVTSRTPALPREWRHNEDDEAPGMISLGRVLHLADPLTPGEPAATACASFHPLS